jgi:DNA-binding transcriptional ArsR family regulator
MKVVERDEGIVRVLAALAHPIRCKLFGLLIRGHASARTLSTSFEVSRPAISQHLAILVDSGLVGIGRQGRRTLYFAKRERLRDLHEYLDRIEFGVEEERIAEVPHQPLNPTGKRFDPEKFSGDLQAAQGSRSTPARGAPSRQLYLIDVAVRRASTKRARGRALVDDSRESNSQVFHLETGQFQCQSDRSG